ncbi:hypothetical protein ACGF5M_05845, partial [Gemmatimonadota bacterium]
ALISGVPTAGKSSLCDAIEATQSGFTHIPLDRYIKPVPESLTFLEWVRTPGCIAWDHLRDHVRILESGEHCYTPKPEWDDGRGEWISAGGRLEDGPGRRMEPADIGYLLPGTHSFAFPSEAGSAVLVFLEVPDRVVAERLTGKEQDETRATEIVRERLGTNPGLIRSQASLADLVMPGTGDRSKQVSQFLGFFERFFEGGAGGGAT